LRSRNPVLRETALHAMGRIADPAKLAESCRMLENDPDEAVRRAAETLSRPPGAGS